MTPQKKKKRSLSKIGMMDEIQGQGRFPTWEDVTLLYQETKETCKKNTNTSL